MQISLLPLLFSNRTYRRHRHVNSAVVAFRESLRDFVPTSLLLERGGERRGEAITMAVNQYLIQRT
jgi:hypothetical protein